MSLHRTNPITKKWLFVGFGNYVAAIGNGDFWAAIGRTVYFAGFTVVGSTLVGLAMALVLNQRFVGRGLLRSFVLVPWAMAPVSVGVLWSFVYAGDYGALTGLLDDLGLGRFALPWLGDGFRALNLVALTQVWSQAPLTALMLLAGLQSMPDSLRRAAMLDGAGPVARFFAITLPWLKPSLMFIAIVTTINSLMAFDILWIMTRGGPGAATTVLSWLGYVTAFQFLRFGEGASLLYFLTALSFFLAIVYFVVFSQRGRPRTSSAALDEAQPAIILAGRVRKPPALPASLGAYRVRRAVARAALARNRSRRVCSLGRRHFPVVRASRANARPHEPHARERFDPHSADPRAEHDNAAEFPDGAAAAIGRAVLDKRAGEAGSSLDLQQLRRRYQCVDDLRPLGTFAGYAFARFGNARFFRVSLWTLLLTRMTPALTLVLPFFICYRTLSLIDTRTGLIIAYSSFLLPLSVWMMRSYFEGVPMSLDRAALIDGCSWFGMMTRVLIPVVRPGIVAAIIFCFLASWNEFLFALILTSTPNAQTIPVVISGFLSQAQFYEYGPMFAASVLSILPPCLSPSSSSVSSSRALCPAR